MLAALPPLRRLLPCLLLAIVPVSTELVNVTIDDDTAGEGTLTFSPYDKWTHGQNCAKCHIHSGNTPTTVDVTQVFAGTWHDSTYYAGEGPDHTINVSFTGSAVYVYNIIVNQLPRTTTFTNISFWINSALVGNYVHIPQDTTPTFEYGVLIYANTSLPNGQHSLFMSVGGSSDSLILFDRIVYTTDSNDAPPTPPSLNGSSSTGSISFPSSTSTTASASSSKSPRPVGAIIGGVVGCVVSLAVVLLVFLSLRTRRQTAARRPLPAAEKMDLFVLDRAQCQPDQRKTRAPIILDLRFGPSHLMTPSPGSATTIDASSLADTETADSFHGHCPQLPSMSPAETAQRTREVEYASRIQALEAHVHALEAQQQLSLSPGATTESDVSGTQTSTWLSEGSTRWTRRSRSRRGSGRLGRSANANTRSANASPAHLHSELASLRSEIAALRGELSQVQLDVLGAAPSYVS